MTTTDPRIDAYIAKSPEFAKPILTHIRTVVHAACPDVEETMRWSTSAMSGTLHHLYGFLQRQTDVSYENTSHHHRSDFIAVVKGERKGRPVLGNQLAV